MGYAITALNEFAFKMSFLIERRGREASLGAKEKSYTPSKSDKYAGSTGRIRFLTRSSLEMTINLLIAINLFFPL